MLRIFLMIRLSTWSCSGLGWGLPITVSTVCHWKKHLPWWCAWYLASCKSNGICKLSHDDVEEKMNKWSSVYYESSNVKKKVEDIVRVEHEVRKIWRKQVTKKSRHIKEIYQELADLRKEVEESDKGCNFSFTWKDKSNENSSRET